MTSGEWYQVAWDSALEVDPDLMENVTTVVYDEDEQATTADEARYQKGKKTNKEVPVSTGHARASQQTPNFRGIANQKLLRLINYPNDQQSWEDIANEPHGRVQWKNASRLLS